MFNEYAFFMMLESVSDGVLDGLHIGMLDGVFDGRHQYPNANRLLSKAFNEVLGELLDVGHR